VNSGHREWGATPLAAKALSRAALTTHADIFPCSVRPSYRDRHAIALVEISAERYAPIADLFTVDTRTAAR